MEFQLSFNVNEEIYLRNPENSEIGKQIVKKGIDLINELGFEHFTFKKLALTINSTEATIYRYFENKYLLLLYILNWYWGYMDFLLNFKLQNINDKKEKLKTVVYLLAHELPESTGDFEYNKKYISQIAIAESSKVYLVKEVSKMNKKAVFKPYKDLCARIAQLIEDYNPNYKFPHSLSTTLIETSHYQQFFSVNLPRLTDAKNMNSSEFANIFLEELLFNVLDCKR